MTIGLVFWRPANVGIVLSQALAADWNWSATSGTPAFHAERPPFFLVFCRDPPGRNELARRVKSPSRSREVWSTLFQPSQHLRRVKRLFPAHRASRAYPATTCRRARVLPAPRGLCPLPAMPFPSGTPPRHCPAAAWLAPETLFPLSPTGRRRHTLP